MEITFDPAKRDRTLRERGLDFARPDEVFNGIEVTAPDERFVYPEPRFRTAGLMDGRLVVIIWTPTVQGRRIISMRHCHDKEERFWRDRMG
jgi:uncharacterized DUF497 family protein